MKIIRGLELDEELLQQYSKYVRLHYLHYSSNHCRGLILKNFDMIPDSNGHAKSAHS